MTRLQERVLNVMVFIKGRGDTTRGKRKAEFDFWKEVSLRENRHMANDHYVWFYTTHFGLSAKDYSGRKVLDIGCGPRGSLEWADMASERIGLDPLASEYERLRADGHKMTYICAGSEQIPFPDSYFDIVTSFNSLDHVDDLDATISEITRVTTPGGLFLFLCDVNHNATSCEPWSFSWDILDRFNGFEVLESRQLEKPVDGMYQSIKASVPYNHADPRKRYGVISAKLQRR